MHRVCLVVVFAIGIADRVSGNSAELMLAFGGQATSSATFRVLTIRVGIEPGTPGYGWCLDGIMATGATARQIRDALVPEAGLDSNPPCTFEGGFPPIKRVRVGGSPAISQGLGQTYSFQMWVQADGGAWNLLEPQVPVVLNGVSFTVIDPELGLAASGSVPAVGNVALIILAGLMLAAGLLVMRRRATRPMAARCSVFSVAVLVASAEARALDNKVFVLNRVSGDNNIVRMNPDGSGVEVLYTGSNGVDGRLAVDHIHQKLYWTAPGYREIRRVNMDGTKYEIIMSQYEPWNLSNPDSISIDITDGKLYVTDSDRVLRSNLDGSGLEIVYNPGGVRSGIAFVGPPPVVPVVGAWGLIVLGLLLVSGASLVMLKRSSAARGYISDNHRTRAQGSIP